MAILNGPFDFEGTLNNMVIYKRKDGKYIMQGKGGASRKTFKTAPSMERTRENASEFGRCANATGLIRSTFYPLWQAADINTASALNKLNWSILKADDVGARGCRSVRLSRHRHLLTGFSFNDNSLFDSVVRYPVSYQTDRDNRSAIVAFPEMRPGYNLHLKWQAPYYQFVMALGLTEDVIYAGKDSPPFEPRLPVEYYYSAWHAASQPFAGQTVELQLPAVDITPAHTLVLSIGLLMGMPGADQYISPVRQGCGKILLAF